MKSPLLPLIAVVALIAHLTPTARAQGARGPGQIPGVKILRDLEYAKPDGKPLLLDLYLPEKAEGKVPLVVWIHGGAWLMGSKAGNPAARLVPQGYASASINYRLSQEARFPAQIHDCKAAIRWLRAHAADYNIDPNRIGVWGSSAGGHLVALLGTSGGVKELEGDVGGNLDQSSRVQAVCDWFGPTDFTMMNLQAPADSAINHDAPDAPEAKLIGGPVQQNKDKAEKANPIAYIAKDCPPFLIMHGNRDNTVPLGQSKLLDEALRKAGVDVTFKIVEDAGHGGGRFTGPETFDDVRRFFDRRFNMRPPFTR